MDIDLLAKMVKEVVMDHDSVTLPGMGSFVAELVPASFADRGYTILPPYRRLYFSPKQGDDNLLAALYAKSNDVSEADAARILENFIAEMKEVLKQRKTLVLTGLGRLRATRENHFFFVADENLDIYPGGFGLQPISLKTHEETPEEVAAAVSNLAQIMESEPEPEPEPVKEEANATEEIADAPQESPVASSESVAEPAPEEDVPSEGASAIKSAPEEGTPSEEEPSVEGTEIPEAKKIADASVIPAPSTEKKPRKKSKFWRVLFTILLTIIVLAVLAFVVLAVLGHVAPQWLDQFLYSADELEILHP